ncbi:MAG: hypothetical protein WCI46_04065 [Verrucomicrobiota bacterium]
MTKKSRKTSGIKGVGPLAMRVFLQGVGFPARRLGSGWASDGRLVAE